MANDGYQALAELDVNRDGVIDRNDPGYASLMVWRDSDADGVSTSDELMSLADAGVSGLFTAAQPGSNFDNGNWLGLESGFIATDGSVQAAADVWFRASIADSMDERAQALGEALDSYSGSAGSTETSSMPTKSSLSGARPDELLAPPANVVAQLGDVLRDYQVQIAGIGTSTPDAAALVTQVLKDEQRQTPLGVVGPTSSLS